MFSMLGLGMDENYMPGTTYSQNDNVLDKKDDGAAEADFTITPEKIGATNMWVKTVMQPNCGTVYYRVTTQKQYESDIASQGETYYVRTLWDSGWGVGRTKESHDKVYESNEFYYSELYPGTEYIIVATGLNYFGGLSRPKVFGPFTMKERSRADIAPGTTITVLSTTKTTAKLHYKTDLASDTRLIYHRIFDQTDAHYNDTEEQMYEFLMGSDDTGSPNCNEWSTYDPSEEKKYEWDWTWTGMDPGLHYKNYWITEDGEGRLSKLGMVEFETSNNDGGLFPAVTVAVDPESIKKNTNGDGKWSAASKITPNDDCCSYLAIFVSEDYIKYMGYEMTDEATLAASLRSIVLASGVPYVEATVQETVGLPADQRIWSVAVAFGADNVESALAYQEFKTDGTGIVSKSETKIVNFASTGKRASAAVKGSEAARAANEAAFHVNTTMENAPEVCTKVDIESLEKCGIKVISLKEETDRILRGEGKKLTK